MKGIPGPTQTIARNVVQSSGHIPGEFGVRLDLIGAGPPGMRCE